MANSAGAQFGKYQILEKLAEGSFSSIYKARLEGIGGFHRLFAIKKLPPTVSENQAYVDRLIEESKLSGLLSHANIVQILDLGKIDESYYIAMEFVNGRDLGTILQRCRSKSITFPLPHALFTILESLKGLEYAHQRKVLRGGRPVPLNLVHRGLTPSNILASFQGEVKLTDFGLARAHQAMGRPSLRRFSYQSPEQINGGTVDHRSDVFSLAIVLYEMLCGSHPFLKRSIPETKEAILEHKIKPASSINPDIPYSLEVILEQALATSPDDRFQTAGAFKESLEGFFHDAGFIFSHSTLAAFLKGLFPQNTAPRARGQFSDQKTVPLSADMPLLDDESEEIPTSIDNIDLLDSPTDSAEYPAAPLHTSVPIDTSVSSTSAAFGPSGSSNDDSTLILRPNAQPDWLDQTRVDKDDDHTQARAKLSEEQTSVRAIPAEKQAATQILTPPPQRVDHGPSHTPQYVPQDDQETRALPIPSEKTPAPAPPSAFQAPLNAQETEPFTVDQFEESLSGTLPPKPKNTARPPEPVRSTTPNSVSPGALSVAIVLALIIGFLLGNANPFGSKAVPTTSPAIQPTLARPTIEFAGPPGTSIENTTEALEFTLDKSGVKEFTLTPKQPTDFTITMPNGKSFVKQFTLKENEIRSFRIEEQTIEKKR